MTEQRRTAPRLVWLALGLAMLAAVLLVVPGTSAAPSAPTQTTYVGRGSTVVSVQGTPGASAQHAQPGQLSTGATRGHDIEYTSDVEGPQSSSSHRPADLVTTHSFSISVGNVDGLYPGQRHRIPIVFHNPQSVPISVRTATTTATGPADCPLETSLILRTRTFIHKVVVPAHGSKEKSLRFGMRKTATDGCQDAVFTITVTATAIRA